MDVSLKDKRILRLQNSNWPCYLEANDVALISPTCLDRDVSSEYTDINDRTLWSQEAVTRSQPPSVLQDLKLYVSGHAEVGSTHFPFCKVSLFPLICLWHLVEPELSSKANCCRAIKFVLCLQATFG